MKNCLLLQFSMRSTFIISCSNAVVLFSQTFLDELFSQTFLDESCKFTYSTYSSTRLQSDSLKSGKLYIKDCIILKVVWKATIKTKIIFKISKLSVAKKGIVLTHRWGLQNISL